MMAVMLYLYWILFFLKNFLDYENIDIRIQILKCHKLNPSPPKYRTDVFRSKIDLRVAPYQQVRLAMIFCQGLG